MHELIVMVYAINSPLNLIENGITLNKCPERAKVHAQGSQNKGLLCIKKYLITNFLMVFDNDMQKNN